MRIIDVEQNSPEWIEARRGVITGSKLGDLVVKRGTGRKIGYYQLIADKIGIPSDGESAMDRGHRLEEEACAEFESRTGKTVSHVGLCISDLDDNIAVSPDGLIENSGKFTEALETKCLGSARHIQAIIEDKIPSDYEYQVIQYFLVIDDLETLHFVFYDDRVVSHPYHCVTVNREEVQEKVDEYREYERNILMEINEWAEKLSF